MSMEVSLASHAHHVPQVGFPHNDPVTIEINEKMHPTGAKLFAIVGKNFILKITFNIDATPIKAKQPNAINEEGT